MVDKDELIEKYSLLLMVFGIWRSPLRYIEKVDFKNHSYRKSVRNLFFFALATYLLSAHLLADVMSENNLKDACDRFENFSFNKMSIAGYSVFGVLVIGSLVHFIYFYAMKLNDREFEEYLSMLALLFGFVVLTTSIISMPLPFLIEHLYQKYGIIGISSSYCHELLPESTIKDNSKIFEAARQSMEHNFSAIIVITNTCIALFGILVLILWTAKFYASSFTRALITLMIAGSCANIVDGYAQDWSVDFQQRFDAIESKVLKNLIKEAFDFLI